MLKLWGRINSINVQKVLWALAELKVPYERTDAGLQFGVVNEPFYRRMNPNGRVPTIEEQTEVVWQNILAVLADAGMGISDVVKITSFLTRHENFARFAQVRAKFLGSHRPASTLLVISSLARPEFLVEVEAIAAKAPAPKNPARRPSARRPAKAKRRARR